MAKAMDLSKFRKGLTKSIEGLSIGFNDPDTWISTGSYILNYLISGDFNKGIPLGKVTCFAGETGSGKSYVCSGNVIKNAQDQGVFVILIDSENALDESWLQALGVDTSEEKLMKLNLSMINDVAKVISDFVKEYKLIPEEDRPKVLFVIDSLGFLSTPIAFSQAENADMKGDMGHKPKQLKALVTYCVNLFGNLNIGILCTNHSYESQDQFNPDPKISGGSGVIYACSIVVAMRKLKLKEDDDGNKTTTVNGIRAAVKIMKTRYNQPFSEAEIQIPYSTGMSPYSGMFDFLEKKNLIAKEGNRYVYTDLSGFAHKYFRKEWNKNENGVLDLVMQEFFRKEHTTLPFEHAVEDVD